MFELTTNNAEQLEILKPTEPLRELGDLHLALIGGGGGAASLD